MNPESDLKLRMVEELEEVKFLALGIRTGLDDLGSKLGMVGVTREDRKMYSRLYADVADVLASAIIIECRLTQ